MSVTLKSIVCGVVRSCNSETAQRLGGTYRLHLHSEKVNQGINQQTQAASSYLQCYL
jgi:hypothetical protein